MLSASPEFQGGQPDAIYGPRATQEIRWHGHNPTDLAANLRGLDLQVRAGAFACRDARRVRITTGRTGPRASLGPPSTLLASKDSASVTGEVIRVSGGTI